MANVLNSVLQEGSTTTLMGRNNGGIRDRRRVQKVLWRGEVKSEVEAVKEEECVNEAARRRRHPLHVTQRLIVTWE